MVRVSIDLSEITLKVLQDSRYFPFDCNSVEQKAAMVLNRWAAHATNDRPDSSVLCAATSSSTSPHLYLSAPIADLVKGILHGHEAIGKSLKHGNLGLGTLHMLDGEVVVLDGVAYQQTSEGTCNVIPDESLSPFMMVTSFDNALAQQVTLRGPLDLEGLQERLLSTLRTKNVFWALKISGRFDYLKCRAVRKQTRDRPLIEVTKEQAIIEWKEPIEGTLVGFYSPQFIGHQLTVPGFHLHFIDRSLSAGGHCLALNLADGSSACASLQDLHDVVQELPKTEAFEQADFVTGAAEAEKQLKEAEG